MSEIGLGDEVSNMKKTLSKLLLGSLVSVLPSNMAFACGACMNAACDATFPGFGAWILFSILSFMGLSVHSYVADIDIWGIPGLGTAIALFVAMVVTSTFIGFILFLFLLLPGIVFIISAVHPNNYSNLNSSNRIMHGVGSAGLVMLIAFSVHTHFTRTDADIVLDWENTYQAKRQIRILNEQGATGLEELRKVILHGKQSRNLAMASDGLAEHGVPSIDVPILIDAYERLQMNADASTASEIVEANLSKLSGLSLPKDSSPEIWRELWATAQIGENMDDSTVHYEVD